MADLIPFRETADAATPEPSTILGLPKPERFLTRDETVRFLGLRSRSSLAYLLGQPDPPPYIQLTKRIKVFPLRGLIAWAEARLTTNSSK